jgi:hypothetical protein
MTYTDKILGSVQIYEALKKSEDEDLQKKHLESCFITLLQKLQLGFSNKRLITANPEFLKA